MQLAVTVHFSKFVDNFLIKVSLNNLAIVRCILILVTSITCKEGGGGGVAPA